MNKSASNSADAPVMSKKSARGVYRALLAYSNCPTSWEERALLRSISSAFPGTDSFSGKGKREIAGALLEKVSPTKWGAFIINLRGAGSLAESIMKTVKDAGEKESAALVSAAQVKIRESNEKMAFETRVANAQRPPARDFSTSELRKILSGKRMLIVEDNNSILDASRRFFASLGAEVSLAMAGGTALKHASCTIFDIVLLDQHLVLDELGTDVARQLREMYKASNPNAIFISYSADVRKVIDVPDSAELFNDFAPKPDMDALASRILEALLRQVSPGSG